MSRLVTQLVAEEPAIVLLGEKTILREKLAFTLKTKNVDVIFVDPKDIDLKINELNGAYKVIWLADSINKSANNVGFLQKLATISSQLITVLPVFSGIKVSKSDFLKKWTQDTQYQLQFIVDCNYYLPSSSFIFGQDIVGNNIDRSIFNYILSTSNKNVVFDLLSDLNFISIDDFVDQVADLIFIPKKQISFLIKGKTTNSTNFVSLIKKLYDAYHNTDLEVLQEKEYIEKVVPFSVSEKVINNDTRTIATYLVKNMVAPTIYQEEIKNNLPEPTREINNKLEEIVENIPVEHLIQVPKLVKEENNVSLISEDLKTEDKEDLNQEIQRIFKDTKTDKKVERVEKIVKSTKKITKKSKNKTKLFYGGLLTVGMAVGMIIFALVYIFSSSTLQKQLAGFLSETSEQKDLTTKPGLALVKNAKFVSSQTDLYGEIIELSLISKNSVLVNLIEQFIRVPKIIDEADKATKNLVLNIINGSVGNTTELTEILTQKVSDAYEKLSLIQATLEQVDLGDNSEKQQLVIDQIGEKIQEFRSGLEIHQQLQQILPDMVGSENSRTYALLLQNNQELRPTGGFIQAVALMNFDDGSLVSYQVYSVYDLDKKLPGKVVPPDEIKTFLGEENWYLRDSNWSPDFPKTSKQISWFIEKSLGVDVDGVIAMNVFSLADLIEAVGPINLPDYNEVITNRNLEERMEFHSEVVLVDSPDSIDYSVKILEETLKSLSLLKEDSVSTLLLGLRNSLDTKQTFIYSTQESEQLIMQTLGWTGSLTPPNCPSRLSVVNCTVDNMAQVESNIGINKANYYLDRTINHQILVSKTKAQHTRNITFDNTAQSNSWPKGTYKTYLRFFINSNAVVDKAMINGLDLNEKQLFVTQEDGYKVVGLRVDVPIQDQISVDLVYSTPLQTEESFSYVFYNQKQSGLDADPFNVQITYSPDLKPVLVAPNAVIEGNVIKFSAQTLDDASLFGVKFE